MHMGFYGDGDIARPLLTWKTKCKVTKYECVWVLW